MIVLSFNCISAQCIKNITRHVWNAQAKLFYGFDVEKIVSQQLPQIDWLMKPSARKFVGEYEVVNMKTDCGVRNEVWSFYCFWPNVDHY